MEAVEYGYDGVGNRTRENGVEASYDSRNRLESYGNASYTHDDNGNTVERIDVVGNQIRRTRYIYDEGQRLIEVKEGRVTPENMSAEQLAAQTTAQIKTLGASIALNTIARYGYNPYGQRISKTTAEGITWYLYNEQGLAAEYDNAGNLIAEYHYTPQSPWMTNPILQKRDGQISYYENDHLGTPQKLVTSSGRVVWEARYRAFGETEITTNEVENPLRFPGQYYDEETGLHQNFFRDYNPALGRYVEADPIGLRGGDNLYRYARENPNFFIDPLGLIECSLYSDRCQEDPGSYYCTFAPVFCENWPESARPPGSREDWVECTRKCLQRKDSECNQDPNSCNKGPDMECIVRIHLECWTEECF